MSRQFPSSERRSFLTHFTTGLASFAAMAGMAKGQNKASTPWQAARHDKDDWLDNLPGKHRVVFDTTTPDAFGEAVFFSNNFVHANKQAYGLENNELAVVIVARHGSTPFGYNDAMWAKYGTALAARSGVNDPKTKLPPKVNLYNEAGYGMLLHNQGTTLDPIIKEGIRFAVCTMSTHGYAATIAQEHGGKADDVFNELTTNLISNAQMVPAGIVTVTRAQERGYSLVVA